MQLRELVEKCGGMDKVEPRVIEEFGPGVVEVFTAWYHCKGDTPTHQVADRFAIDEVTVRHRLEKVKAFLNNTDWEKSDDPESPDPEPESEPTPKPSPIIVPGSTRA